MLSAPVPILRIFDADEARDFYLRYLGFELGFEHRTNPPDGPLYLELRRGACVLHLTQHHGDCAPFARLRIALPDLDAFLAELHERGHPRMNPGVETAPWGERYTTIIDPFSNRLTFWTPLTPAE